MGVHVYTFKSSVLVERKPNRSAVQRVGSAELLVHDGVDLSVGHFERFLCTAVEHVRMVFTAHYQAFPARHGVTDPYGLVEPRVGVVHSHVHDVSVGVDVVVHFPDEQRHGNFVGQHEEQVVRFEFFVAQ